MNLDLNLIKALQALIDTGSVTQMGERLNVSQPAASRIMTKLRMALGDPLLVRTSKGYVLTPLAQSLRGAVVDALAAMRNVFSQQLFDPKLSTRQFQLASTDYGVSIVLQPLIARALHSAPQVSYIVTSWHEETLKHLENGVLDLALYADDELPADFHYRDLFTDTYCAIVRQGHALAGKQYALLDDFLLDAVRYQQIVANFPRGRLHELDNILQRLDAPAYRMAISTPYFSNAPFLVVSSDLMMVLPKRMAQVFAQMHNICMIDIPSTQENFSYRMIWHERAHRDQGLKWLRERIVSMNEGCYSPKIYNR